MLKYIFTSLFYLTFYYAIENLFAEQLDNNGWYDLLHSDTTKYESFKLHLVAAILPGIRVIVGIIYIILVIFSAENAASFFGIEDDEDEDYGDTITELVDTFFECISDAIDAVVEAIVDFIDDLIYW